MNPIRNVAAAATLLLASGAGVAATTPDQNKQLVGAFGEVVFARKDLSALPQFMRDDYIQHNPLVPQGRDGFRTFFEGTFAAIPDWRYSLKQIVAEGDPSGSTAPMRERTRADRGSAFPPAAAASRSMPSTSSGSRTGSSPSAGT
jgi:ketosteroid isomerase-like protein